jgi:AAA ATPase-like protein
MVVTRATQPLSLTTSCPDKTMLHLRTLGLSEIQIDDHTVKPEHAATFLLLLLTALRAPRPLSRVELAALLWSDASPPARNHRLRSLLHRVRRTGVILECTETTVRMSERPAIDFRDLVPLPRSLSDVRRFSASLGAILPGVDGAAGTPIAARLEDERDAIRATVTRWVSAALGIARESGDWPLVEQLARAARAVDPYNEEAWLTLAEVRWPTTEVEWESAGTFGDVIPDIDAMIAAAERGRGGSLLVWGRRGSGKTRLLHSIHLSRRGTSVRSILCSARSERAGARVAAPMSFVARLLDQPGAAGCDPVCYAMLRAAVKSSAPNGSIAGRAIPPDELTDAVVELLAALADEATTVILVDDMPAAAESAPEWSALVEGSRTLRVAWVFACRADDEADLVGLPDARLLPRCALQPVAELASGAR